MPAVPAGFDWEGGVMERTEPTMHTSRHSQAIALGPALVLCAACVGLLPTVAAGPAAQGDGPASAPAQRPPAGTLKPGPLHTACKQGKVDTALFMLDHGADVNARNDDGLAPIHCLVEALPLLIEGARARGEEGAVDGKTAVGLELAELLLDRGADVSLRDPYGNTPLHKALVAPDVARLLLAHGADPNAPNDNGQTPLHRAVLQGYRGAVRMLLGAGADPDRQDLAGRTCLGLLPFSGCAETLTLMCEAGADPDIADHEGYTPLLWAALGDQDKAVAVLLEAGARTDLLTACALGDLPRVRELAEADRASLAEPSAIGVTPLQVAANKGRHDVVSYLLEAGVSPATPDAAGTAPLHSIVLAAWNRQTGKTFDPDEPLEGWGELFLYLAETDQEEIDDQFARADDVPLQRLAVGFFLAFGEALQEGPEEYEAELDAERRRRAEVARLLVAAGAPVEARNAEGRSALSLAVEDGNAPLAAALIGAGADPNGEEAGGLRPLHMVRRGEGAELARLLCEAGADPNAQDDRGRTPLHWAAMFGWPETVRVLLEYGAQVDTVDEKGRTPLDRAKPSRHREAIALLMEAGARP
jgi:cytohesin